MQKSTIFPEIKKRYINCYMLLCVSLAMRSQSPVGFEDASVLVDPGAVGWRIEQQPENRWGLDSLDPISGRYSLQHSFDNDRPGCDYFVMHHHPFRKDSLSFSFRVRHAYDPSSANNWQVAILSEFDLAVTDGIVAGVNLVGSDDMVKLWRARDGDYKELCASGLNYQEDIGTGLAPLFRISWKSDGMVSICYAPDSSVAMHEIATGFMDEWPAGRSVVIRYEYSSAQDRKLWLDELLLEGNFKADTMAPVVTGWMVEKRNILSLDFSEAIVLPDSSGFALSRSGPSGGALTDPSIFPDSISVEACKLILCFPVPLPNRELLALVVQGVCDVDGNCMNDTLLQIERNEAQWGDLVINEVMADPDPPVLDSYGEYVELYNRSEYPLKLEGWILESGGRTCELTGPQDNVLVQPGEYLVVEPLSLPNAGGKLALFNEEGRLVHAASYQIPYDAPRWKSEGGWSLESPDPDRVCNISGLWEYSMDPKGGTPGEENSVAGLRPDIQEPVFLYFGFEPEGFLSLYFSEMVQVAGDRSDLVVLNPGNHHALEFLEGYPTSNRFLCRFAINPSILSRFAVAMPAVSDCSGNLSKELHFTGGEGESPAPGSVMINEIMYDPLEGGAEYIELLNPGQRFVDIRELGLEVTAPGDEMDELLPLSDHSRMMGPGDYLVLTRHIDHLMDSYDLDISGSWAGMKDFKSLPDGGGRIRLCDRAGNTIDAVSYRNDMHLALITDTRGISLERTGSACCGDQSQNWHSAASIEDYATPGRLNSQSLTEIKPDKRLTLDPSVISPDNDGYHDMLLISPGIEEPGWVIRLWITKPDGLPVRMLANNHVAGASSQYTWDGRNDKGQMAASGFYVVHLRAYEPRSGSRWNAKKAVGLVY